MQEWRRQVGDAFPESLEGLDVGNRGRESISVIDGTRVVWKTVVDVDAAILTAIRLDNLGIHNH